MQIRLGEERWQHICKRHPELAEHRERILACVEAPRIVYRGRNQELLALADFQDDKQLVVVYIEESLDGFIVTAYVTRRLSQFRNMETVWPSQT